MRRRVNYLESKAQKREEHREKMFGEELRKLIYDTVEYIYNDRLRWPHRKAADKAKGVWNKVAAAAAE